MEFIISWIITMLKGINLLSAYNLYTLYYIFIELIFTADVVNNNIKNDGL